MAGSELLSNSRKQGKADGLETITPGSVIVSSFQGLGSKYEHNEDSLFTFHSNFQNDSQENHFGVFIIGDGMGGA